MVLGRMITLQPMRHWRRAPNVRAPEKCRPTRAAVHTPQAAPVDLPPDAFFESQQLNVELSRGLIEGVCRRVNTKLLMSS